MAKLKGSSLSRSNLFEPTKVQTFTGQNSFSIPIAIPIDQFLQFMHGTQIGRVCHKIICNETSNESANFERFFNKSDEMTSAADDKENLLHLTRIHPEICSQMKNALNGASVRISKEILAKLKDILQSGILVAKMKAIKSWAVKLQSDKGDRFVSSITKFDRHFVKTLKVV